MSEEEAARRHNSDPGRDKTTRNTTNKATKIKQNFGFQLIRRQEDYATEQASAAEV